MPNDQISPEQISQITAMMPKMSAEFQRMAGMIDDMNSKFDRSLELLGKSRDLTTSEGRELAGLADAMKNLAAQGRKHWGDEVKAMDDYSVAVKAAEDRLKQFEQVNAKAAQEAQDLAKARFKIEDVLDDKRLGLRKDATQDERKELKETLKQHAKTDAERDKIDRTRSDRSLAKIAKKTKSTLDSEIAQRKAVVETSEKEKQAAAKAVDNLDKLNKHRKKLLTEREEERRTGRRGLFEEAIGGLGIPGTAQAMQVMRFARRGAELAGPAEGAAGAGGLMGGLRTLAGGLGGAALGAGAVAGGYGMYQTYRAYQTAQQMAPQRRELYGLMGQRGMGAAREAAVNPEMIRMGYGGQENLRGLADLARQIGGREAPRQLEQTTRLGYRFGMDRGQVGGMAGQLLQAGVAPQQATKNLEKIFMEGVKGGMDRAMITKFAEETVGLQQQVFEATGENNAENIAKALSELMRASGRGEAALRGPEMGGIRGLERATQGVARGAQGPVAGLITRALMQEPGMKGGGAGETYFRTMKAAEQGIFGGKQPMQRVRGIMEQAITEAGGKREDIQEAFYGQRVRMPAMGALQPGGIRAPGARPVGLGVGALGGAGMPQMAQIQRLGGREREAALSRLKEPMMRAAELMAQQGVMTRTQFEKLSGILAKGDIAKGQKALEEIMDENKDPMQKLVENSAKQEAALAKAADDILPGIKDVNDKMVDIQTGTLNMVTKIADAIGATGNKKQKQEMEEAVSAHPGMGPEGSAVQSLTGIASMLFSKDWKQGARMFSPFGGPGEADTGMTPELQQQGMRKVAEAKLTREHKPMTEANIQAAIVTLTKAIHENTRSTHENTSTTRAGNRAGGGVRRASGGRTTGPGLIK